MLDGKARRGDFSGGDRIAFVRCSESHAASGLQPHRQGKSRRVILLVQKELVLLAKYRRSPSIVKVAPRLSAKSLRHSGMLVG
ncbi:hypothetical protein D9M69_708520 [compost metagenome]